ncbi:hypothetical protein QAD02_018151 [Eretmocerus hayati]|uniref:Uncharacterized protein n=1 Tax=Eretmocerus hayati TaxID=131215 RepID=A0ACC2PFJ3_9HYME|nr:hypothetical protein QAD02_018151 [Eretmocerus hayati]
MSKLSSKMNDALFKHIGEWTISDARLKVLTGISSNDLKDLVSRMSSLRVSENRNAVQAVVTCLFKLRSGREYLIKNHTSPVANKLFNIGDRLALICDGTYISHEKSSNNAYQRKSYSGQKKKPLCKPMTICTIDRFVIDSPGTFYGTENDATIMRKIMEDPNGIKQLLKPGDIFILDRGFRDVKKYLEELGYVVLMPALVGANKQLTAKEANESRKVTKCRIGTYARISCYLNNEYGKRLNSDEGIEDAILEKMTEGVNDTNELATLVEEKRWSRRSSLLTQVTSDEIEDSPQMIEHDLKILFTGSYQLFQAVSYLAEIHDEDDNIGLSCVKESPDIVRFKVRSRHINRKTYKCFIKYDNEEDGLCAIRGYCCECANGLRTVGCCSHVASIIYYLAHARYLSKIVRPAEILSKIFEHEGIESVIAEESEYED